MRSIRAKMLMWFGLTLGVLMTVFGFTTYSSIKGTVIPLTRDLSQEILKARSAEIGRLIQGYLNEVKTIASRDPIRSGDFEAISRDLIKREHTINPDFEILFFTDAKGRFITTKGAIGSVADRGYWKAIMEQGQEYAISDPLISKSTGERIFVVASVVTNEKGERIGIAAATVLLKTLSHIAESIHIGESGAGWVVDSTGLIVAHPNPALPMKLNVLKSSAAGYQGLEEIGAEDSQGRAGPGQLRPPGRLQAGGHIQPHPQHARLDIRHHPAAIGTDGTPREAHSPDRLADGRHACRGAAGCGRPFQNPYGADTAVAGWGQCRQHRRSRPSAGYSHRRRDSGACRRFQQDDDGSEGIYPKPDRDHCGQGTHPERAQGGHRHPGQPAPADLSRLSASSRIRHSTPRWIPPKRWAATSTISFLSMTTISVS